MAELSKIRIGGVDYPLKDETARQNSGVGGNSVYYMDYEVEYPEKEPEDGEISFTVSTIQKVLLSNSGVGIKIGDIIVASNGTLCKVTSVDSTSVTYDPIGTISGTGTDTGGNADQVSVEPAKMDRPKIFFGSPLQQTKDEIVTTFSYRSETLSFDCYAEIKAQGNSTLNWPKKNQTVKLYKDTACTEKFKVDFKGWGKQNKFVIKANWRDLTHVRDIVSVRLEGDCMRSNPDYNELPELLKTSPNMGGIDGFPVVVYAAGVYQGRYMWNIPKDKWMTNMDDELDEHCILCSEDYNSSLFRAAANINGNDWTDEIHDTVPASIKTRWNEIISFVMNSTDEEFVANLDSHIKVSTLIDRHIMGLYSCDFDGYGKNQLYITYDGQQWYANRYDKDGTWGNYWTGESMLPPSYGREQYEDMKDGKPGNLLFIRLEQLFCERLKNRWNYLKDRELSIPNTINRVRELYDITPPYVIEEDYASTTANGAHTGIPNKATCTIQQIEKFVVERHAWMDEYMASLTPEVEVPCTGITLDKAELTFDGESTKTITATVAPSNTTDSVVWVSSNPSVASITVNGNVCTVQSHKNGNTTITANCGTQTASCSVTVEIVEVEEPKLLYSIPEETTFDGTNYINTGIQLFAEDKPFTVLIDWTKTEYAEYGAIIHCVLEQSGWPGMTVWYYNGRDITFSITNNTKIDVTAITNDGQAFDSIGNVCAVFRKDSDGKYTIARRYNKSGNVYKNDGYLGYIQHNANFVIGARQNADGTYIRYAPGIMNRCEVYNYGMTDEEINAWLNA